MIHIEPRPFARDARPAAGIADVRALLLHRTGDLVVADGPRVRRPTRFGRVAVPA